jgi:hypothetical protein
VGKRHQEEGRRENKGDKKEEMAKKRKTKPNMEYTELDLSLHFSSVRVYYD